MPEGNYEFRKRLNAVHRVGRRNSEARPERAEVAIRNGWRVVLPLHASPYLVRVGQDLQDYLFRSMGVSVLLVQASVKETLGQSEPNAIILSTREVLPGIGSALETSRSARVICRKDAVVVCGYDERGTGQGCYYLEDLMNLREAPFLQMGDSVRAPVFQPRMVHSGWGCDQFPDSHLNAIAHAGMDAVLVFVKGVNQTTMGYLDFNDLIDRAAQFGLDVYFYSYLRSTKHPDDPDAEAYYESTYGELMKACPGARGVVLVGESCEFPSKDPATKGRTRRDPVPPGGEDDSRPFPGWWPCKDYPQWLDLVKKVVRHHNPSADIVFWTYNWGWAPEAERVALIESLPKDISLQATFEMFETIQKDGVATRCVDYTVSFAGPGKYFKSEAAAAHERGIPLYAMSNTGGLTWDIGVVPYLPVPFQWKARYEALLAAHEQWGLCGLMESHHYGWWPSFVSELAKWAYWRPAVDLDTILSRIAVRDFGRAGAKHAVAAWRAWSEAITQYVPTNEDQYGPFRVGPSYPLVFLDEDVTFPSASHAHFGSRIVKTLYRSHAPADVPGEIALFERMLALWTDGLEHMADAVSEAPPAKLADAMRMRLLGEFIQRCVMTTIHVKKWFLLNRQLRENDDVRARKRVLDEMVALAQDEVRNAEATIPLVEADSRLGWEPSMEYMTDTEHLEWKIEQVRQVVKTTIPEFRKSL
jgi:hypothetical protein